MSSKASPPLKAARAKAKKVQHDLEVACAELELTQGALHRHLPADARHADVAWALAQNDVVEQKVHDAAEELEEVQELIASAEAS
jgi:hypothetical protein